MRPSDKVLSATAAGAVGTLLIWLLQEYWRELPDPVEAAIIVLLTLAAGYLMPEGHPAPSAVETITTEQMPQPPRG